VIKVDTTEIMTIGLNLVGWKKIPPDSAVHVKGRDIRKVLISVDVSPAELLLAKSMECDAVIAHHPIGVTSINFHKVFDRHVEYMEENGIPMNAARDAVRALKQRAQIKSHANIYKQTVDSAKSLQIALVNIHQPCDEFMRRIIWAKIRSIKDTDKVSRLLKIVREIPEFRFAVSRPLVALGSVRNSVGRAVLILAAGTNGGYRIAKLYFENNITTVIYLHVDPGEVARLKAEKLKGNLVILGHLAGDSIGLNALADKLEQSGVQTVRLGIILGSVKRGRTTRYTT
jgi:putative NIF3 family GTP cyclohydrolase 1 type 2